MRALLLLAVLAVLPAHAQTVRYVDADAAGAATGLSWADAFPALPAALAVAQPGDEVWIAEGTYTPTDGADRAATFQLRSGVALYGGFAGDETARDQRDWTSRPTILSGDIGVPGVTTDNSYHVVTGSGTDASAVLDGVTITGARADGAFPRNRGGGVRNVGGSPTLRHVVIRDNAAFRSPDNRDAFGAGMFNDAGSHPALVDVRFERNVSAGVAGGMANRNGSHPVLVGVTFVENEAALLAGGMANDSGSSPTLVHVRFERNRSDGWTGALDNYQASSPTLVNVVFVGNECQNYGGAITNDTGSNGRFVNVLVVGNVAHNVAAAGAAGMQTNDSSPVLIGVTFVANRAGSGAGGLGHRGSGTTTLRNAVVWANGTELLDESGGGFDVSHALVAGGFAAGTAVLDADPLVVLAPDPGADGVWGTPDDAYGDLRLRAGSPALDAADAAHLPPDTHDLDGDGDTAEPLPLDLGGALRVQGGGPDLGAYEGAVVVSTEPGPTAGGVRLGAAFPQPGGGEITIPLDLGADALVDAFVVDALGRRVQTLERGVRAAGRRRLVWETGGVAPGAYAVIVEAGAARVARRVVVAR